MHLREHNNDYNPNSSRIDITHKHHCCQFDINLYLTVGLKPIVKLPLNEQLSTLAS